MARYLNSKQLPLLTAETVGAGVGRKLELPTIKKGQETIKPHSFVRYAFSVSFPSLPYNTSYLRLTDSSFCFCPLLFQGRGVSPISETPSPNSDQTRVAFSYMYRSDGAPSEVIEHRAGGKVKSLWHRLAISPTSVKRHVLFVDFPHPSHYLSLVCIPFSSGYEENTSDNLVCWNGSRRRVHAPFLSNS